MVVVVDWLGVRLCRKRIGQVEESRRREHHRHWLTDGHERLVARLPPRFIDGDQPVEKIVRRGGAAEGQLAEPAENRADDLSLRSLLRQVAEHLLVDHRRRAARHGPIPLDPVDPQREVATDAVFRFVERVLEANGVAVVVALFAEVPGAWS